MTSLDHLIPEVRRLMSEGKGDRVIAETLNKGRRKAKWITRHQVRNLMREVDLADAKQGVSAAPVSFSETLRTDPEAWALRISARWRASIESIIETGQLLLDAKEALPHGAFGRMIESDLPFSARTAQMLMATAADKRLTNPNHGSLLPPSWRTMFELTKLSDEEFDRGVQEQIIRPDMERKDIEQIRPRPERRLLDEDTFGSSDGPGSQAADDPDPTALGLQQGLDTSSIPGTADRGPQGEGTGAASVANPERQPDVPDGSPVSPGPSEHTSMPGGGLAIAQLRDESGQFTPEALKILGPIIKEVRAEKQIEKQERRADREEVLAEKQRALPNKRYGLMLVDVPRHFNVRSDETGLDRSPENHYPTMTFQDLCDLPVPQLAADDCIIVFWSTAASLIDDLEILAEWGFVTFRPREAGRLRRDVLGPNGWEIGEPGFPQPYRTMQVWDKVKIGLGYWFRDRHEFILLAARGNVVPPAMGTQDNSLFSEPKGEHSAKPDLAWIDRLWPNIPKLEMFARRPRNEGWDTWGYEAPAAEAAE
jgi:N6-adenosine-specific RNA methylase IME4